MENIGRVVNIPEIAAKLRPTAAEIRPRLALGEVGNKLHYTKPNEITARKPQTIQKITAFGSTITVQNKKPIKTAGKINVISDVAAPVHVSKARPKNSVNLPNIERLEISEKSEAAASKAPSKSKTEAGGDIYMVVDYVKDIMKYMQQLELQYPIAKGFLENHTCTPHMRVILIDWLVQVCQDTYQTPETLHLTVACIDRFLQVSPSVDRTTLQLVGTAALYLSSKYEELYYCDINDLIYACDHTYSKKEILWMEQNIFKTLDFSLSRPFSIRFLRRYSQILKASENQHALGKYVLELALQEYSVCHLAPSMQAAAASCLACCIMNSTCSNIEFGWTEVMEEESGYKFQDLKCTIYNFAALLIKAETWQYQAIRQKYSSAELRKISFHAKLKEQIVTRLASKAKLVVKKK